MDDSRDVSRARAAFGKAALWLISLVVAAGLGAWIQSFVTRPRLRVEVMTIAVRPVDPDAESDSQKVVANPDIVRRADGNTWSPRFESQTNLRAYLGNLQRGSRELSEASDRMASLREAMEGWPNQVTRESLSRIIDILWSNDEIVNEFLIHRSAQNDPIFRSPPPSVSGITPVYRVEADSDGQYYLSAGRRRLQFVCHDQHQHPVVECMDFSALARRTATALAYGVASDLEDLRVALLSMLNEEIPVRELKARIDHEIDSYSYWHVRAVLTNSGEQPVSVAPQAALYLNTAGRKYHLATVEEEMPADTRIVLQMVRPQAGAKGDVLEVPADDPIVIPGGQALSITYRASTRNRDLKDHAVLAELYGRDRDVNGKLAVFPITSYAAHMGSAEPVESPTIAFAEIGAAHRFPKVVRW